MVATAIFPIIYIVSFGALILLYLFFRRQVNSFWRRQEERGNREGLKIQYKPLSNKIVLINSILNSSSPAKHAKVEKLLRSAIPFAGDYVGIVREAIKSLQHGRTKPWVRPPHEQWTGKEGMEHSHLIVTWKIDRINRGLNQIGLGYPSD